MQHKFRFFIFILACMVFTNCKHKCERDPDAIVCPGCKRDQTIEGMKDYFFFKTGTWWIYQETNTGALDTVTVYYDFLHLDAETSEFQWKANSTYFNYNFYHSFNESFSTYCLTDEDCTCHKLNREKSRPGDYIGGGNYFTYPLFKNNYNNAGLAGQCRIEEFYDHYNFNGNIIESVARIDVPLDESTTTNGQHTKYWWAKNIGIIEFENLNTSQHWFLIDQNILQ